MRLGIEDLDTVESILKHPAVYGGMTDDFSPSVDQYSAAPRLLQPNVYFLMPEPGCLFIASHLVSTTSFTAHQAVLPGARGKVAIRAGKAACEWMFANTQCEVLVGYTPEIYRHAVLMAVKIGFHKVGIIPMGIRINGTSHDLIVTAISKGAQWQR